MLPVSVSRRSAPIGKFDELEFQPGDAVVGLFYFTVEQVGGNLLQMVGGACGGRQYHNLGVALFEMSLLHVSFFYGADGSSAEFTNFHFKCFLVILFYCRMKPLYSFFVLEGSFPKMEGRVSFQFSYNASEDTL